MSVVVDASVILKWVLDEPGQAEAEALLDQELTAPALWLVEAANALWRRVIRGELLAEEAQERLAELGNAPVRTSAIADDLMVAVRLAIRLRHPVYDCLYLAAALREGTHVVTADVRFFEAVAARNEFSGSVRILA